RGTAEFIGDTALVLLVLADDTADALALLYLYELCQPDRLTGRGVDQQLMEAVEIEISAAGEIDSELDLFSSDPDRHTTRLASNGRGNLAHEIAGRQIVECEARSVDREGELGRLL